MWRGSVSHLYYAQRLYQLPLGVLGISLATAIFPVMSSDAARNDLAALQKTVAKGMRGTIFVAIPATVGLIMVARPLISAAFEHGKFTPADTKMVTRVLAFYAVGLCGYFAQQILARAFYAMQDSKTPMRSALVAVAANFVLNLALVWPLDRAGFAGRATQDLAQDGCGHGSDGGVCGAGSVGDEESACGQKLPHSQAACGGSHRLSRLPGGGEAPADRDALNVDGRQTAVRRRSALDQKMIRLQSRVTQHENRGG